MDGKGGKGECDGERLMGVQTEGLAKVKDLHRSTFTHTHSSVYINTHAYIHTHEHIKIRKHTHIIAYKHTHVHLREKSR